VVPEEYIIAMRGARQEPIARVAGHRVGVALEAAGSRGSVDQPALHLGSGRQRPPPLRRRSYITTGGGVVDDVRRLSAVRWKSTGVLQPDALGGPYADQHRQRVVSGTRVVTSWSPARKVRERLRRLELAERSAARRSRHDERDSVGSSRRRCAANISARPRTCAQSATLLEHCMAMERCMICPSLGHRQIRVNRHVGQLRRGGETHAAGIWMALSNTVRGVGPVYFTSAVSERTSMPASARAHSQK